MAKSACAATPCAHDVVELKVYRGSMQGSNTISCARCHAKLVDECATVFGDDGFQRTTDNVEWRQRVAGCTHPVDRRVEHPPHEYITEQRVRYDKATGQIEKHEVRVKSKRHVPVPYCSVCGESYFAPSASVGAS